MSSHITEDLQGVSNPLEDNVIKILYSDLKCKAIREEQVKGSKQGSISPPFLFILTMD